MRISLTIILALLTLTSCTLTNTNPNEQGPKQAVGTVTGMVLGGKVANDFAEGSRNEGLWTIVGVTLGAFLGNEVELPWTDKTLCLPSGQRGRR